MSGSRVARVSRATVLFLAGVLAASVLGASAVAAPSVRPLATQTRSTSCHGINFQTIDVGTGFRHVDGLMTRQGTLGDGFFACDPNLPHRAVVTRVQFTLRDSSEEAGIRFCGLFRSSLRAADAGGYQKLAQVSATQVVEIPGRVRKTDSTIEHATVNTTDWAYELQCQMDSSSVAGIYGADVIYTISSTNG